MVTFALTVLEKVFVLFLMIAAGYACGKLKIVTDDGAKNMSSVLFYIVTPCVIISSLQNTIGQVSIRNLTMSGLLSIPLFLLFILLSRAFFRGETQERKKVFRFGMVYSNCGFIGLPLAQALLGNAGVAYASMFIAIYNLFVWTHGISVMGGKEKKFEIRRAVLNPGIIGLVIGFTLFALSLRMPPVLLEPISCFSDLNTPLAMIVIGVYVSEVPLRSMFQDKTLYLLSFLRLLAVPAACLLILMPLHPDRTLLTSILILCAAPTGANTVMFAAQFGGDTNLSSRAVALTTIFSLVTMPIFPVLAGVLLK